MGFIGKRAMQVLLLALLAIASSAGIAAGAPPSIVDFTVPTGQISGIAQAPDGTIWYVGLAAGFVPRLGAVGPAGPIEEIGSTASPSFGSPAVGSEGDVWYVSGRSLIRYDPHSGFSEVPIASGENSEAAATPARGGGIWFTNAGGSFGPDTVGRATPAGKVTEYALPHRESSPEGIVETTDGSVWFSESFGSAIGRLFPSGHITEYPLPRERRSHDVAADPRGGVVFTEGAAAIGRIDRSGHRTQFGLPAHIYPYTIAVTTDDTVWFTFGRHGRLGRLGPAGAFSEVRLPEPVTSPGDVLAGSEGDVWYSAENPGNCGIRCNEDAEVPAVGFINRITPAPVAEPADGAAAVRFGRASVTMRCAGAPTGSCEGEFSLRSRGKALGSSVYALGAGTRTRLGLALGPRLRRSLIRRGALRVEAVALEDDGTAAKRRFVLRAAAY